MSKITYNDKVGIEEITDYPVENQITDDDLNEIKKVVNENDDTQIQQGEDIASIKESITTINEKNTAQDKEISAIKEVNTAQDELIAKLKGNMFNETAEGTRINVQDSSDLPSTLEVSGGERQATREGYNIFDYLENVRESISGLITTIDEKTGYITTNGTPTQGYVNIVLPIDITDFLEDGETYTLWQENHATTQYAGIYLQLNETKISDSSIIYLDSSTKNKTFVVNKSTYKYSVNLQIGLSTVAGTFNNYKNRYMVYKGTETKPFELYGVSPSPDFPSDVEVVEGSLEINKVNKNWFDIDCYSYIPNWQELTINNNTFKLYSKATGTWWDTVYYKYFVKNISKNITLSFNITDIQLNETGNVCRILVDQYDELNNNLNANTYYDYKSVGQYSKNINLKENCSYIILRIYIINGKNIVGTYVEFENFQLEKGSTATDYTPHQSEVYNLDIQQPMLSGDTFVKEDGNWFEVHGWENYVITGNESWTQLNSIEGWYEAFCAEITGEINSGSSVVTNIKSNMFLAKSLDDMFDHKVSGIGTRANGNIVIAFDSSYGITNINSFKAKLQELYNAGTAVETWYKLATPTKLPCTPEQVEVLEQLYNMPTYRPVTNIFTIQDLANLKLSYVADSKIYVDNKINDMQANLDTINQLLSTTATSALLLNNMQSDLESEVM